MNPIFNPQEPKKQYGAKALLFDRLTNDHPDILLENMNAKFYNKNEYINSIIGEIARLFNTRQGVKHNIFIQLMDDDENTLALPMMYGMPDFNVFDVSDKSVWWRLCKTYETLINYFEPRINNTKVKVREFNTNRQELILDIHGTTILNSHQIHLNFPITVSKKD